jgi:hypothetical protein
MIDLREESVNAFDPMRVNSQSVSNAINENELHLKSAMDKECECENIRFGPKISNQFRV